MATRLVSSPEIPTIAALLARLGGVPAERVRFYPLPGTATEQDVIDIEAREKVLCELVDGVLVEKPMGYNESFLAGLLITLLNNFILPRDLGAVTGEAGMMRLLGGLIRIPDVAFVTKQRLPSGELPRQPVPTLVPDLAVEILSEGNTPSEIARKRREYFQAGVRLVWVIDPATRSVAVYTGGSDQPVVRSESDALDGGEVLPGFSLHLRDFFAKLPR